jgi:hypothetical protein
MKITEAAVTLAIRVLPLARHRHRAPVPGVSSVSDQGWIPCASLKAIGCQNVQVRAEPAIVTAFTPICVAKFRAAPDADAKLAELMKTSSWSKASFVRDGGWAMVGKKANYAVADACARILAK